jgi:hypothetical protein
MLQHARDLNRAARHRGRRHVATLCLRLMIDGIVNAGIEHMEAIMTAKGTYKPIPWLSVLLAAVPGLFIAFSRRYADLLAPALAILGIMYLVLLVFALPIVWWRRRRFPVWALLPAGMLMWFLTYTAGTGLLQQLLQQMRLPYIFGSGIFGSGMGIIFLNTALAIALFVVLLRGRRLTSAVWALIGLMALVNVLGAIIYGSIRLGGDLQMRELLQYLMASLALLAEGLMLVAVGLLAARQHGVLAILVVVGGYSYMFMDTDYLFGYPSRDWSWLPLYFVTVSLLYLVVTPVALLRAKTRLGRAFAVFGPVVVFLVIRLIIPFLAFRLPLEMRPGDAVLSINVLLSLILAWLLYSHIGDASREARADDAVWSGTAAL